MQRQCGRIEENSHDLKRKALAVETTDSNGQKK